MSPHSVAVAVASVASVEVAVAVAVALAVEVAVASVAVAVAVAVEVAVEVEVAVAIAVSVALRSSPGGAGEGAEADLGPGTVVVSGEGRGVRRRSRSNSKETSASISWPPPEIGIWKINRTSDSALTGQIEHHVYLCYTRNVQSPRGGAVTQSTKATDGSLTEHCGRVDCSCRILVIDDVLTSAPMPSRNFPRSAMSTSALALARAGAGAVLALLLLLAAAVPLFGEELVFSSMAVRPVPLDESRDGSEPRLGSPARRLEARNPGSEKLVARPLACEPEI